MKAIRNYNGHKGHILVYLTKDDVTKIIRDYFEDAADEINDDATYLFDFTFGNQDEYDAMVEVYIQPLKNAKSEESNLLTIGVGNPSLIFKDSVFFKEDE